MLLLISFSCNKEKNLIENVKPITATPSVRVINDFFNDLPVVVAGSERFEFMVAFGRQMPDGTVLKFEEIPTVLPAIMEDNEGNLWDIAGYAIRGPREGQRLPAVSAFMGYWFAWSGMYPGAEIFEGDNPALEFEPAPVSPGWTVPSEEIFAGSGFDLIPALDFPKAKVYRERDSWGEKYFLHDTSLVLGVKIEGRYRLYPRTVLDFHEIVNDTLGSTHIAVAYCPLTGTATAWNREVADGLVTTFGVSGLLYNSNLIAFDRATESLWSQMRQECINGAFLEYKKEIIPILETTWETWKVIGKNLEVMTFDTGHSYNYSQSPYCDYACNTTASPYPIQHEDHRLPPKERVLGVAVDGKAKVFRFSSFGR